MSQTLPHGPPDPPPGCCPDPSLPWERASKRGHVEGVLSIYHRETGGSPVQLHAPAFSRGCSPDPPRRFSLTVGQDWVEIDCAGAALVIVANMEGRGLQRVPTPEQADEIAARIVEVAVGYKEATLVAKQACGWIRPASVQFFEPPPDKRFFLSCLKDKARLQVTVVGG